MADARAGARHSTVAESDPNPSPSPKPKPNPNPNPYPGGRVGGGSCCTCRQQRPTAFHTAAVGTAAAMERLNTFLPEELEAMRERAKAEKRPLRYRRGFGAVPKLEGGGADGTDTRSMDEQWASSALR